MAERGVGTIIGGLVLIAGIGIGGYLLLTRNNCPEAEEGMCKERDEWFGFGKKECYCCTDGQYVLQEDVTPCEGGNGGNGEDCTGVQCTYDECIGPDYYYNGAPDPAQNCKCVYRNVIKNAATCRPHFYNAALYLNGIEASQGLQIGPSNYDWCGTHFLPKSPDVTFKVRAVDQWNRPMQGITTIFGLSRHDIGGYYKPDMEGRIVCADTNGPETDSNGESALRWVQVKDQGANQLTPVEFYCHLYGNEGFLATLSAVVHVRSIGAYMYGFATLTKEGQCWSQEGKLSACEV